MSPKAEIRWQVQSDGSRGSGVRSRSESCKMTAYKALEAWADSYPPIRATYDNILQPR